MTTEPMLQDNRKAGFEATYIQWRIEQKIPQCNLQLYISLYYDDHANRDELMKQLLGVL